MALVSIPKAIHSLLAVSVISVLAFSVCNSQYVRHDYLVTGEEVIYVDAVSCNDNMSFIPYAVMVEDSLAALELFFCSKGNWLTYPRLTLRYSDTLTSAPPIAKPFFRGGLFEEDCFEKAIARISLTEADRIVNEKPVATLKGIDRTSKELDMAAIAKTLRALVWTVKHRMKTHHLLRELK